MEKSRGKRNLLKIPLHLSMLCLPSGNENDVVLPPVIPLPPVSGSPSALSPTLKPEGEKRKKRKKKTSSLPRGSASVCSEQREEGATDFDAQSVHAMSESDAQSLQGDSSRTGAINLAFGTQKRRPPARDRKLSHPFFLPSPHPSHKLHNVIQHFKP